MMPPVTLRERVMALALLALALAALYAVVIHPLLVSPLLAVNEEAALLQERHSRIRSQIEQTEHVRAQLQLARKRLAGQPVLLEQASASLASSALLQRLEEVVEVASPGNRSCAITNRTPLPGDAVARFQKVAVQVRLQCGTQPLAAVLHALEGGAPALFVENLTILAAHGGGTDGRASGGLDATFDLSGYLPSVAPVASSAEGTDAP